MIQTQESLSFSLAFMAGVFSFFSPCLFPLIPSYLSYITGLTFERLTQPLLPKKIRFFTIIHSILFITGFTLTFILLGIPFTFFGIFLSEYQNLIKKLGGIIIVLFGLHIAEVINLGFLECQKRPKIKTDSLGFLGSFLVGVAFSLSWTPCIGPIMSSILILTSTAGEVKKGIIFLLGYSLGLGVPLFLSSITINNFLAYFQRFRKFLRIISIISGLFLITIGIMILTDYFGIITSSLLSLDRLFGR